ncbi:MAG: c-type cytochrome [Burkholderiales bacterium]
MYQKLLARLLSSTSTSTIACARRLAAVMLVLIGTIVWASNSRADPPDPQRGRALYENHCQFCHTSKVHSRANKLPLTRNELRGIVDNWQRQENLSWTRDDTADVVEYLNRTHYHFAPGQ